MPLNLLTDLEGIRVGHATELRLGSGVTVVVFEEPAVASGLVLGGAPGGRDTDLLSPSMTVERVDAFVLSGGSAFGLDAAGGVQAGLRAAGRGFKVGDVRVPIVPQAILMDLLSAGDKDWKGISPYGGLGLRAYEAARPGPFALGTVGAGTGATTGTFKGGIGSASAQTGAGHQVAALLAVNAVGSATIGDGPHFWAAPFERDGEFGGLGWPARFEPDLGLGNTKDISTTGTTIGVIATDAPLSKAQAYRLAVMAHGGLARAVLPAHLPIDGDTIFAASTGRGAALDEPAWMDVCHAATLVTARAVARGVFEAEALPESGAQPCSWRDRFGGSR